MSLLCLLSISALGLGADVAVRPLTGESQSGRLTSLTKETIGLQSAAGPRSIPSAEIMWVEFPHVSSNVEKPALWIDLLGGSKLQATGYTAAAGRARIQLTTGQTIEVPTRAIHSVRFRQQSTPELAGQWREIIASQSASDLVVIRKSSMRTVERDGAEPAMVTEQALDQLEGTLRGVTADSVTFEIDGQSVEIRREKLEGLIYYHPGKREYPSPLCRLFDSGGSTWLISDVTLAGDRLTGTTVDNIAVEWPLNVVAKVDFAVGNIAFLSELEPDSGGGEPAVSLQPSGMAHKFGRVFQVRPAPPLGADAFRIGGVRFDNGLSLHSPANLVYRVPAGFRWFRAVAGIDDSVGSPGRFDLVILGEGRVLFRHTFADDSTAGSRQPLPIDLDITGVRRISIVLHPIDGQDIGDQLDLCEARFTK